MQLDICINKCIFRVTLQVLVKGFAGNFLRKVHPGGFIAAIFFCLQMRDLLCVAVTGAVEGSERAGRGAVSAEKHPPEICRIVKAAFADDLFY